ncbi:MAG: SMC-Scp complex subunit ScpB [Clostridia bacterium]|nr:SMC-Scp complex subunit ScpB [Clostridia bacterium]
MTEKELIAAVEAVIFAAGSPIPIKRIIQAFEECAESKIIEAVEKLIEKYSSDDYGVAIMKLGESVQMCSKKVYGDYVRRAMELKKNTPLSQAAFEVLAVIAYNQPVTKAFVEQVRGVDCSGVVGSLCAKGLVEEKGRLELPGRPLLYGTTDNFLRCFGVSSIDELPRPEPSEDSQNGNDNDNDNTEKFLSDVSDEQALVNTNDISDDN